MQRQRNNGIAPSGKLFENCLLSTAYFPPVEFFAALANAQTTFIEKCEIFQKQSYRTRCHIYSANGLLALTIPVRRGETALPARLTVGEHTHKVMIDRVEVDYSKPWVLQHKRAIEAAYMTTPFFEYYKDELFDVLDSGETSLFAFNFKLIELIDKLIGLSSRIQFTTDWTSPQEDSQIDDAGLLDLRSRIHPKFKGPDLLDRLQIKKPYYQGFSNKQGFISNLSILDLLCNEGPNSVSFLKAETYR